MCNNAQPMYGRQPAHVTRQQPAAALRPMKTADLLAAQKHGQAPQAQSAHPSPPQACAGRWFNTPSAISLRGSFYPLWMPTPLTSTWQRIQALGEWALSYHILTTAVRDQFDGAWCACVTSCAAAPELFLESCVSLMSCEA